MITIQQQTKEWYQEYYSKKGKDRNDVLTNSGVLFQKLAVQKSVIQALGKMRIEREDCKILDIGCGTGDSLQQFLSYGFEPGSLYGIDIILERILEGKKKFPNINLTCGDASKLEYVSDSFDLVMESTIFIQLTDDGLSHQIANEMLRVVKPSGYIMLTDWRYSYGYPEYRALSKSRITSLFQVGTRTSILLSTKGALIPPIGRMISSRCSMLYFIVQNLLPFLVGQVTTVLQKKA